MPKAIVNGVRINYKVQGQGEPLVLIMGFIGPQWAWFFQARALSKHYLIITLDNRGVGKSQKPKEPFTVRSMAEDTVGLMDYLGIDKAHILGISMGGMIAQEIAINHPERVRKLVLGSTSAGGDRSKYLHPDMIKAAGVKEGVTTDGMADINIAKASSAAIYVAFNGRIAKMFSLLLSRIFAIYVRLAGGQGYLGQMNAICGYSTLDRLGSIRAPTLVITGTDDRIVLPHSSDVIASHIPNAKLVKIEHAGHVFFIEERDRFNKEILDFLRT